MKRDFTSKDARSVRENHRNIINSLLNVPKLESRYKKYIIDLTNQYIRNEVMKILKDVPIDELNKNNKGIRLKVLKENGYKTVASVVSSSVQTLSLIRGISEDGARKIMNLSNEIFNRTKKEIKIRINPDEKKTYSGDIVAAISIYKRTVPIVNESKDLVQNNKEKIEKLIDVSKPATSLIRWLFTSKRKKEKALDSYHQLKKLLDDEYNVNVNNLLRKAKDMDKLYIGWNENAWKDFKKNTIEYYNILEEIIPGLLGDNKSVYGLPDDLAKEIEDEQYSLDGLTCRLRRYQELGVKYILHQKKVLLGDEMGLGKTVQAIATMVSLKNSGSSHFFVVCPASVLTNWCREINKHSNLNVIKIHGASRVKAFNFWTLTGGVAVTTYETINQIKFIDDFRFTLLVVYEAHYIKNFEANRSKNVRKLCNYADRLLFMTGTALENKVDEMINLIKVLKPQIASQVQNIAFMSSASQFKNKVAPVYYRRKRDEVLTELPDLIESKEWCSLNSEEEIIYESTILEKKFSDSRRVSWNIDDLNKSSKARRLKEIIEEAKLEERKVIVFSYFLDTINKIQEFLGSICIDKINGSVPVKKRQEIIDQFNIAPSGSVLLSQIYSGGTGLNIQSASVVIICEPQLKPSIENQAISRAYRMGQSRNVLVYRLLCEDTIDERLTMLLEEKQNIFNAFADESLAAKECIEIDNEKFKNIFDEEYERINKKRKIDQNEELNSSVSEEIYIY